MTTTYPAAPGRRLEARVHDDLPALAWVARVEPGRLGVDCGRSVRVEPDGIFEGSWAGGSRLVDAARSADVFGSGLTLVEGEPLLVTPSHTLDGVFLARLDGAVVASNTLCGLLAATGLELRADVSYPPLFGRINAGLERAVGDLPTSGAPITQVYFHNVALRADGSLSITPKPHGAGFADYAGYRERLVAATRSVLENAPGYDGVVALSSGYDSTAAAAIGAAAGVKRTASLRDGVAWRGYSGSFDSGAPAAAALGLQSVEFGRLDYLDAPDLPEAEFLANGMSGEDIVLRSMEPALRRSVVLSGFWGGAAWRGLDRSDLRRTDLSGASLVEFRLRADFIHLPVPYIGGIHQPDLARIRRSPEMRPFSVGGVYDEPVPRRLAEEAGVPRGAFATQKLATSRRFHIEGLEALSAPARADFEAFAGKPAVAALPRRPAFGRRHRLAIRIANLLRAGRLVEGLERRRREYVHIEPQLGSLLLRWAVARILPRYGVLAGGAATASGTERDASRSANAEVMAR